MSDVNVSTLDQIKAEITTAIDRVRDDFGSEIARLDKMDKILMGGGVAIAALVVLETRTLAQLMKGVGQLAQTVGEIAAALPQGQVPVMAQETPGPVPSNGRHGYDPGPQEVPEEVKATLKRDPGVVNDEESVTEDG
jgi:hypothetical protein